jgi:hypothetical protein
MIVYISSTIPIVAFVISLSPPRKSLNDLHIDESVTYCISIIILSEFMTSLWTATKIINSPSERMLFTYKQEEEDIFNFTERRY